MTFEEAFRRHLNVVGIRFAEYFTLIADPQFTNRINPEWLRTSENLKDAIDTAFRLKIAWQESGEIPRLTEFDTWWVDIIANDKQGAK